MTVSNDDASLAPLTTFTGPSLQMDFPGLRIGVAEYAEGPTGCTVFHFPQAASVAIDVRGGSPGIYGGDGRADAICLAGGSLYGREAIVGVQAELFAQRGYSTAWDAIALVAGAIIYDYRPRDNAIYPDKALGRVALRAATDCRFPMGARGAGVSATVGKLVPDMWDREPSGQGAAFREVGPVKVAVFSVVNAVGVIVNRQGEVVRGNRDRKSGIRHSSVEGVESRLTGLATGPIPMGNTTLTLFVTNQKLDAWSLRQVGRLVHSSMARAIQPFHGLTDGDVLFAATTNDVEENALEPMILGTIASELAWDAVLASIPS